MKKSGKEVFRSIFFCGGGLGGGRDDDRCDCAWGDRSVKINKIKNRLRASIYTCQWRLELCCESFDGAGSSSHCSRWKGYERDGVIRNVTCFIWTSRPQVDPPSSPLSKRQITVDIGFFFLVLDPGLREEGSTPATTHFERSVLAEGAISKQSRNSWADW